MMLQPISYSLIINLATLVVTGLLAWHFDAVWLVLVSIMMQTHIMQRFGDPSQNQSLVGEEMEEDDEPCIGFTAKLK